MLVMQNTLQLSEAEQRAFAICGITNIDQIGAVGVEQLLRDVSHAKEIFPEEMAVLTPERLSEILKVKPQEQESTVVEPPKDFERTSNLLFPRSAPVLTLSRHQHRKRKKGQAASPAEHHSKSHSIHCAHPVRVYFCSWAVVLFYVDLLAWLIIPPLIILGVLPDLQAEYTVAALAILILPYFITVGKTRCSVCNMQIFSLRGYTRNGHAHKFPLLGVSLPTALHIIFFLWFRCPNCGTPQKLSGKRRSRR